MAQVYAITLRKNPNNAGLRWVGSAHIEPNQPQKPKGEKLLGGFFILYGLLYKKRARATKLKRLNATNRTPVRERLPEFFKTLTPS